MAMKRFISLFFSVLVWCAAPAAKAQKPVLADADAVSETVTREIDAVFHSEDFLKKKEKKFPGVKGFMAIDIGVMQSGKVSTFFKADSDIRDIDFINWMSAYILQHRFRFRLEKQQRYKIRYNARFE
jgi:hypothetical protein